MVALATVLVGTALDAPRAGAATEGLVLRLGGEDIASVWQGTASGEIAVHHEETGGPIEIVWLDQDSTEFQPVGANWTHGAVIDDPAIAQYTGLGQWTFEVTGLEEGMTDIVLSLRDNGVPVYTSPPIEVHVEEEHLEPVGLVLRSSGLDLLGLWEGNISGTIQVPNGATTDRIDIYFLAEDSTLFQPDDPDFQMVLTVFDPSVATAESIDAWAFTLDGVALDTTSMEIGVFHIDHIDWASGPLPVVVYDATAVPAGAEPLAAIRLDPPTPSPARDLTLVRYSLPSAGPVELALYDVQGRRMQTLTEGDMPAGDHTVRLAAGALAQGRYFLRLATPSAVRVEKLTIAR
jgi:hypothetical protein